MEDANAIAHAHSSRALHCARQVKEELEKGNDLSIIRLVDALVLHAYTARASDIHIDPFPESIHVRFRIDGVLQDAHVLPRMIHGEIISRIKILCGLRTDEHQSAQDGRFHSVLGEEGTVDVRVSIVPLYYGENAVLRLLSNETELFSLERLGFTKENAEKVVSAIKKPYGMILATGPTGSGKTTTLYALIQMLNNKDTAIITIEDPIEYAIPGINQIQVNSRTGLTFSHGLRSMLRQDPNIIMVGEIRDIETAGLAVNVSLTGHLVLSTLHTNDAATTLPRLLDMKVEPYLIASTVNIAIGQRLLRRLCSKCKVQKSLTQSEVESIRQFVPDAVVPVGTSVFVSQGCTECSNTGYQGRVGIHEVLVVTEKIREAILRRASAQELRTIACSDGMIPIVVDGFSKVQSGDTTIEEVLRMRYE